MPRTTAGFALRGTPSVMGGKANGSVPRASCGGGGDSARAESVPCSAAGSPASPAGKEAWSMSAASGTCASDAGGPKRDTARAATMRMAMAAAM
jgi:hypothetical protein